MSAGEIQFWAGFALFYLLATLFIHWLFSKPKYVPTDEEQTIIDWRKKTDDWRTASLTPKIEGKYTYYQFFSVEPQLYKIHVDNKRFWLNQKPNQFVEDIINRYEKPISKRIDALQKSPHLKEYVGDLSA